MNRKGQALVEFVLILPVFLMILFAIVDFGNLLYRKNQLENDSTDIVRLIRNGEEVENILKSYSNISVKVEDIDEDYKRVTFSDEIDLVTPGLDRILGNPCIVTVKRVIANDE